MRVRAAADSSIQMCERKQSAHLNHICKAFQRNWNAGHNIFTLLFFSQIEETDETGDRSDRRDAREARVPWSFAYMMSPKRPGSIAAPVTHLSQSFTFASFDLSVLMAFTVIFLMFNNTPLSKLQTWVGTWVC